MEKEAEEDNKPTKQKLIAQTPDWLDLPNPLATDIILEHLELDDYIRFSAVCKEWRSIQKEHRIRYSPCSPPLPLPFPWLRCLTGKSIHFYLPARQKSYTIPLRSTGESVYMMNEKHGLLLLLSNVVRYSQLMRIFNPITGHYIKLPPLLVAGHALSPPHSLSACISSPLTDSKCTILINDRDAKLYLCRLRGSSSWKTIDYSGYFYYDSPIFFNDKLYAVSLTCESIYVVDTLLPGPFDMLMVIEMDCSEICMRLYNIAFDPCLVNFLGELILVTVASNFLVGDVYDRIKLGEFHVYQADFSTNKWVLTETLGDHALFMSLDSKFLLRADDFGCMKNTIYLAGGPNGHGVAWRAYDLRTKGFIDGPPMPLPFRGRHCSLFLPTLDECGAC